MLHAFLPSADYFSKSTFSINSFRNTIRVSNSLDPDQAGHFVGPDLGRNCLQRLSADDTSRQIVKPGISVFIHLSVTVTDNCPTLIRGRE